MHIEKERLGDLGVDGMKLRCTLRNQIAWTGLTRFTAGRLKMVMKLGSKNALKPTN